MYTIEKGETVTGKKQVRGTSIHVRKGNTLFFVLSLKGFAQGSEKGIYSGDGVVSVNIFADTES